jgi:L-cysteine desulfidase
MENTLIQDNFDEISKLSNEDKKVIMTYFGNWTESLPSYFEDGDTLSIKVDNLFESWLSDEKELEDDEIQDIVYDYCSDLIREWCSDNEYNIQLVLDVYNGNWGGEIYELFEEWYDEYLAESN